MQCGVPGPGGLHVLKHVQIRLSISFYRPELGNATVHQLAMGELNAKELLLELTSVFQCLLAAPVSHMPFMKNSQICLFIN